MSFEELEQSMALLPELMNEIKELKKKVDELKYANKLAFSINEAAEATGWSYGYIYDRVSNGTLPSCQDGRKGKIVIKREHVMELLNEQEEKTAI